ncbi:MAG TPA: flagellar biosynthesis protein FlhB, partial [Firmicutes bacterium]|nr:flagellar biosynthesis protein FlhB [Bacillota bacterium]
MVDYRFNLQLFAGEKTEPATPRRREEARKKGQVAKSAEVSTAVMVLTGFILIRAL